MRVPRTGHVAELRDERVLVVGGNDGYEHELFDPLDDTWRLVSEVSPTPADGWLREPGGHRRAISNVGPALLSDGRV